MKYNDFSLILASKTRSEARVRGSSWKGNTTHQDVVIDWANLEPLRKKLQTSRKKMTLPEVAELGIALSSVLLPARIRTLLEKSKEDAFEAGNGLRIRLEIWDPSLAYIPWEYVYLQGEANEAPHLTGFLLLDRRISFVRHEPLDFVEPTLTGADVVKVFAGFAEPARMLTGNKKALDNEPIYSVIEKEDAGSEHISIDVKKQLSSDELRTAVQYGDYHVFSFSGHGTYMLPAKFEAIRDKMNGASTSPPKKKSREELQAQLAATRNSNPPVANTEIAKPTTTGFAGKKTDTNSLKAKLAAKRAGGPANNNIATPQPDPERGYLILEAEEGKVDGLRADELAMLFRGTSIQLVVMDACDSAQLANTHKWTGLVSALVGEDLPAVIGMQYTFSHAGALAFWPAFYNRIAAGVSIDEAVAAGRLAIAVLSEEQLGGKFCRWDFGYPALYMRSKDGELFKALAQNDQLKSKRETLEKEMKKDANKIVHGDNAEGDLTKISGNQTNIGGDQNTTNVQGNQTNTTVQGNQSNIGGDQVGGNNYAGANMTGGGVGNMIMGNVGTYNQEGDIVGGDKITSNDTNITYGFPDEGAKTKFIEEIENLRQQVRELRNAIEDADNIDAVTQEELAEALSAQVSEIRAMKKEAEGLAVNDKSKSMKDRLDNTNSVLEKVKSATETAGEIFEKVKPALSLLLSARHLFGLP